MEALLLIAVIALAVGVITVIAPGRGDPANRLPDFREPFIARGALVVFVADK